MGERLFMISVMGQTGVGKSSLLNALFDTTLPTGALDSVTKRPDPVDIEVAGGGHLTFVDLPGIGETADADAGYLEDYRRYLNESDAVIWAIHADSRSTTFDLSKLEWLFGPPGPERDRLAGKMTYVLTKADLIGPPPWLYLLEEHDGLFVPDPKVEKLLTEKADRAAKMFLHPYATNVTARTYNDMEFTARASFTADKTTVWHHGLLTRERANELTHKYDDYAPLIERIYDNYRVIPCSALFRYNLTQLLIVLLNKLDIDGYARLRGLTRRQHLDRVELVDARKFNNMVVMDAERKRVLFDLTRQTPWSSADVR